ncbi:S8 family serine peptidase [Roseateles sp. DC23W]|uniref:S8 family serine peptidase n=1 Tax=Pelomonas dachongensis TaxID=3299029 RepID=A0ABW7EXM7_9BURK
MKVTDRRRGVQPITSKAAALPAARFLKSAPLASISERTIVDELSVFALTTKRANDPSSRYRKQQEQARRRQKYIARRASEFAGNLVEGKAFVMRGYDVIVKEVIFRLAAIHEAERGEPRRAAARWLMTALKDERLEDPQTRRGLLELLSRKIDGRVLTSEAVEPSVEPKLIDRMSPLAREFVLSRKDLCEAVRKLEQQTVATFICRTVSGLKVESLESLAGVPPEKLLPAPNAARGLTQALQKHGIEIAFESKSEVVAFGAFHVLESAIKSGLKLMVLCASGDEPEEPRDDRVEAPDIYVAPAAGHVVELQGELSEWADHVVFYPPARTLAAVPISSTPPQIDRSHHSLDQNGLRQMLDCPPPGTPDAKYTGAGVKVAVVDSGVFAHHPALLATGAKISDLPMPANYPKRPDFEGHGTAMAWNVLTCAPGAEILSVPASFSANVALSVVRDSDADVVVCSFYLPYGPYLSVAQRIREITAAGKVVLAAAGNGQPDCFPGYLEDVISVGGVYQDNHNQLLASPIASRYVHPGSKGNPRPVPDVCGPCGDKPRGVYFAMPCPAGSIMDRKFGSTKPPHGDGLGIADGWWGGSGTSGATSLVAGVAALLIEKARKSSVSVSISTPVVKNMLASTSLNVTNRGGSATNLAHPPCLLVQAAEALKLLSGP